MTTVSRQDAVAKLLAYCNGEILVDDVVHWAEDALVALTESDVLSPDDDLLFNVLGYVGAGDTLEFPLTWEVLSGFLRQLGTPVRVVVTAA